MTKRMRTLSLLTTILVITLLFTGCLGLKSSPGKEIEAFFENVSAAIQSGEPSQVADLWGKYPIVGPSHNTERAELEAWAAFLFANLDDDERVSVEIRALDSMMVFDSDRTSAVVVGGMFSIERWKEGEETPYFASAWEIDPFRVTKVGGEWKFEGWNGLLSWLCD